MDTVPGDDSIAAIRSEMQQTMEEAAGIYRTGPAMTKAADVVPGPAGAGARGRLRDTSRTWNTELVAALEVANMLDIAERHPGVRAPARGVARRPPAHRPPGARRREVPAPPARAPRGRRPPRVERQPVTITRWAPGERVYGR